MIFRAGHKAYRTNYE